MLWAEGLAHQTLTTDQILYLVVAYDWLLFGHNLVKRLNKGYEIFFFCFFVLEYLKNEGLSFRWIPLTKEDKRSYPSSNHSLENSRVTFDNNNNNNINHKKINNNNNNNKETPAICQNVDIRAFDRNDITEQRLKEERRNRITSIRQRFIHFYMKCVYPKSPKRKFMESAKQPNVS
jgi:hypothetical protein